MSAVDFASLLCSRLCHDLVGPVGSLYNGVELLADETDPDMRQRCLELLADSAQQTASKLKFFRLAFGAGGGFGEEVDVREAQAALEGLHAGGRVHVEWMAPPLVLPKDVVRMLLNLAMTAGDALLRGGRLKVTAEAKNGSINILVHAEGPRVLLDPELQAALEGRVALTTVTPRAAAAFLAYTLANEAGAVLQLSQPRDGTLLFGATIPARS